VASPTDKVLAAEDAESATVELLDGAEATLVRSESLGQAVLITNAMPAAPAGKTYQMWLLTDNGTLASAGLMDPSGDQTILLSGDAAHATAAAISVEPEGGSKQPTSDPVALIDFSTLEQA
jgi:anti-sigma-K factor RskA